MIGIRVSGLSDVILELRNTGKLVRENARKTMHRGADKIVERARLMAPVDEGNLEDAIQKDVKYEGKFGRLAIDIVLLDHVNGVDVSAYGREMHEGVYNLGPKSEEKQKTTGVQVGREFITRAYKEQAEKMQRQMVGTVEDGIEGIVDNGGKE